MSVTLKSKLKAAFRRYYKNQGTSGWDKLADIKNIESALPKNYCLQACAGTFWITWPHARIQTVHSKKNWWTAKVLARKVRGKWVRVLKGWPA